MHGLSSPLNKQWGGGGGGGGTETKLVKYGRPRAKQKEQEHVGLYTAS